jgi:hypothetical protein
LDSKKLRNVARISEAFIGSSILESHVPNTGDVQALAGTGGGRRL